MTDQPTLWVDLLPDVGEGIVHGIKSLSPCIVQCDGCGRTHRGEKISWTVIQSGIVFNPRLNDGRRMCEGCWEAAGWVDDTTRGWRQV